MRKNRTKHEAKKPRLAKRALALCFALIFVCSCLLPAFANSEAGALADTAVVEEQDEQPTDPAPLNEGGENPTEGNEEQDEQKQEEANASKETSKELTSSSSGEASGESQSTAPSESASSEGSASTAPGESASSSSASSEASGEPEQPASSEPKTEQPASSEQPANSETKTEETKPAESKPTTNTTGDTINQGEATYTYRFWPKEIDAFDLEAIDDAVEKGETLNNAAKSRVDVEPCTVLTVMNNAHLGDYKANIQQPTKPGYEFAGWYTIENGTNYDFFLDEQNVNDIEESKTIDVFAKWEKVESTVEDEMEKTEPTTEDELEKAESGKANESKDETLLPVEGEVGLMNNEGHTVSIAVKAENLPGKVNKLVVTDLNEDEEGAAFGNALAASSYKDWAVTNLMVNITPKDAEGNTVEPNEAVTVHFSGLESLMIQYSSEMNLKVLHVKRDGTLEALSLKNVQTKETQEGTVLSSFAVSTTSFSPFVLAASESASIEPARLGVGSYPSGSGYVNNTGALRQITVGESIVVSCDSNHWYGPYTWSSDNTNVIRIVSSDANTVRIKAVGTGTATIKHDHYWDGGYTFYVAQSRSTEKASIFFLNKPNANKDSNQWSEWLPSSGNYSWKVDGIDMDGTINTSHAKWSVGDSNAQNKNILLQDTDNASGQYVTEWPDGAKTKAWTLYNPQLNKTQPTEYTGTNWELNNKVFTDVLGKMWSGYQSYLKDQLDVTNLTLEEAKQKITQITLTPYKISTNEDGMHIDCEIGVTGISYEAKFWVKAPGKTVYEQAYGKAYKDTNDTTITEPNGSELRSWKNAHSGAVTLNSDGSLPTNITENGVSYTLKNWYAEDGGKASFPHTPTDAEKYDGVVNFYAEYVADNQGRLDEYPYITVEKQINDLPSDKVDELLKTFKVNVGSTVLDCHHPSFTRSMDNDVTTLRWKIDSATAKSYHVTESDYDVDGYKVETGGDINTTVYVEDEDAAFTATAKRITEQNSKDFKVGESGEQYWVFVASLTSSKNVVISNRTLSAKERASIVKAVKEQTNGAISNQSTLDDSTFYSVAENQEITIKDGGKEYKITYSNNNDEVHGPGIHIAAESMWNMVASVNYSVTDAQSADIKLTNTYTPATTSLTVTKTATKDGVEDTTTEFNFTLTLGSESNSVTWRKSDTTGVATGGSFTGNRHEFKLKGGESITFSGISVEDNSVTVTEDNYSAQHYTTTIDGRTGREITIPATTLKQNQKDGTVTTVNFTNEYTTPKLKSMTIQKKVTGAFGERMKDFTFKVELSHENPALLEGVTHTDGVNLTSFKLKHGGSVTLGEIPIGTTITITETGAKDYDTKATNYEVDSNKKFIYEVVADENGNAVLKSTDNQTVANSAITVENNFDGTPDTGVLLDTLPYLILLAVAVAGGVLVVVRKRKHRDE